MGREARVALGDSRGGPTWSKGTRSHTGVHAAAQTHERIAFDDPPRNPSIARSVHPAVKLQRIPTLYRWASNGKRPANALVEGECMSAKDVGELVNGDE